MEVEEGTDVNIVAKIKGVPFPTLTWFKAPPKKPDSKEPVVYDTHVNKQVVDDTCTLVIPQSRRSDTGLYSITAVNNLGTASKEMRLNVLGNDCTVWLKRYGFILTHKQNLTLNDSTNKIFFFKKLFRSSWPPCGTHKV